MNPEEAAQWAVQDSVEGAEELPALDDGIEPVDDAGASSSVWEALWNTEPDTPLHMIESPWNPEHGGVNRIYRGFQKMSGYDGMPAIADLVIGILEEMSDGEFSLPSRSSADDEEAAESESNLPVFEEEP